MTQNENTQKNDRREFLGTLAVGAASLGLSALAPLTAAASPEYFEMANDADAWFEKVKGKHRVVYDVPKPHDLMPFIWPRVFMMTNVATGTPETDLGVVVVLRHDAIGYAMDSKLWEKYKFGEVFKANDPKTNAPSTRNPFQNPAAGDFSAPGIGPVKIGINELQASGVMFCVCDAALTVYSAALAGATGDAAAVKKEWIAGLLPGIQVVPSGVWADCETSHSMCG